MSYIYHLKPEPMLGHELIPLNQMEGELYQGHVKKYQGRESLIEQMIPILNCKWNDVVQFSALNPQIILDEIKKYQPDLKLWRPQCFKVHKDQIIGKYPAVLFNSDVNKQKGNYKITEKEISLFDEDYRELTEVPQKTLECWQDALETNGKLLWFPFITHILIHGIIDTTDFEVIKLTI